MKSILLLTGGIYSLAFAVVHKLFWGVFRWKVDLQRLIPINRAIIQVLNIRLIYVLLVMGLTTVLFAVALLSMDLGMFILGAVLLFWFMRAIEQIMFFGLHSAVSITLFGVFLIGSGLFSTLVFM